MLAEIDTSELTDDDRGQVRVPAGQQHAVGAWRPRTRERDHRRRGAHHDVADSRLYRRLPHGVLVCDGPAGRGDTGIEKPCVGRPAGRRGRRDSLGARRDAADAGQHHRSRGRRGRGIHRRDPVLRLLRTCGSTSPTRTSARCCWRAGLRTRFEVAERMRQQAADLPGAAQLLGAAVAGRAALGRRPP